MDLLTLALICAPMVDPDTTLRVIAEESGGDPFVIHDNRSGASYRAGDLRTAVGVATTLIRAGHRIDVGLMQINYDAWLKPTRFSLEHAFDPCTNIRLGSTILSADYAHALPRSHSSQEALYRALSEYNSGSDEASWDYARRVLARRDVGRRRHP
jgi:type IV secretion system protein VirB1